MSQNKHFILKRGTLTYKDLLNCGNAESDQLLGATEKSVQFDDPVNIQFTSVSKVSSFSNYLERYLWLKTNFK